jgi:PAS domain S-box-containing protein
MIPVSETGGGGAGQVHSEPVRFAPAAHLVQFYETDAFLIDVVARFAASAVGGGDPLVVIATAVHREALDRQLQSRGVALSVASEQGVYVALDAEETLERLMVDGRPDPAQFDALIGSVVRQIGGNEARVHAFSEMVAVLWARGERDAAVELERLWNELAGQVSRCSFCAYPIAAFAAEADTPEFQHICQHGQVHPTERHAVLDPVARSRNVAELQQRAHALEQLDAERRRAENSLAERDALLRALVTASPAAMVVIDATTRVRLWNPAAERLFGWAADEVLGHPIPIVPPDEQDECAGVRRQLAAGECLIGVEACRMRRDGSTVPVAISAAPLGDGSDQGIVLIFDDLTDRKPAEEARARLAAIVESSDDAIVGKDLRGIVTSWNTGAQRIFGYRPEEMIGQSILRIVPPDRAHDVTRILAAIGRGERVEHFESERVRKDGQRINVSLTVSPIRDSTGRIIGASKIARDITAEKRAERARQRMLRELSTLYAVGQTVAAELDRDRVLQTITDAATDLSGAQFGAFFYNVVDQAGARYVLHTVSGLQREAFEDLGLPRNTALVAPTFTGAGVVRVGDVRSDPRYGQNPPHHDTPAGHAPVVSYLAVPVCSRSGEVFGGLFLGHPEAGVFSEESERVVVALAAQAAIALDNARLYAAEQHARTAAEEANRAKDQFLAMLGHELRNPLAAVRNAITTAALDPARARRALEIARHGTDQLTRLIEDLLDVTRLTQGRITLRREVVSLTDIVERAIEAIHPLFEERSIALTVSLPPRDVRLNGDAARLEQIIGNLLANAAKYTEPGGRVTVTLERDDRHAVLRVRDTGIGIGAELLPRIFDLFVQAEQALDRARGGLGIGLTLVKRLVELHDGSVEAHSPGVGLGSEFVIKVPAATRDSAAAPAAQPPATAGGATGTRVLIVEDNADAGESLMMLLELLGLRVRVARDADTALEAARAYPPDVMLIDIGLPGMNGYELAHSIRQDDTLRHIRLIALTGYGQEEDRQRALAAGFDYHLVKPVDLEKVERLVAGIPPARETVH